MPKYKAKVLKTKTTEKGVCLALIQLQTRPRVLNVGQLLTVKWGAVRSLPQNALYWAFLTWLVDDAGLKDKGHFFPETLHENLKKHLIKGKQPTTTDFNKVEFSEYFEKVEQFIQEFFEIDTAPFWESHKELVS